MALLAHETVFEAVDLYAISWGTPRRPAYNLGETTKRKSQDCIYTPIVAETLLAQVENINLL
jgi:hypothetical protein